MTSNASGVSDLSALHRIRIVLVNTTLPANIGAAARALKVMGLTQLTLVAPRHFPSGDASAVASGAADILAQARVVETLEEAIADCTLVIGTSARSRSLPWPLQDARAATALAWQRVTQRPDSQVAMVFGREDRGLTNEELALCQVHLHIATDAGYSALNVAAAVQVVCHELRMHGVLSTPAKPFDETVPAINLQQRMTWDEPPISQAQLQALQAHWLETLTDLDFFDPDEPRLLPLRLSRLLGRLQLDRSEYNLLRGMLSRTQALRAGKWPPKRIEDADLTETAKLDQPSSVKTS